MTPLNIKSSNTFHPLKHCFRGFSCASTYISVYLVTTLPLPMGSPKKDLKIQLCALLDMPPSFKPCNHLTFMISRHKDGNH